MRRFGMLLAAGVALATTAGASAASETAIGGLVISLDDARWRAELSADGTTITCIAEGCLGAVVDVRMRTDAPICDAASAHEAAAAAFPTLPRTGVNMRVVSNLAVTIANSWQETYDPDVGSALFACLDRDGVRYEFTTRVPDGPVPYGYGAVVAYEILERLRGLPVADMTLTIGPFALTYATDAWVPATATPDGLSLTCLPPNCNGRVDLLVSLAPAPPGMSVESCLPPEFAEGDANVPFEPSFVTAAAAPGVIVSIAGLHSFCRAMSPPVLAACAVAGGQRILFHTSYGRGCHRGAEIGIGALTELVAGLRPAAH